jgi:glycosyltransferase involved in cell wall biosynthesis
VKILFDHRLPFAFAHGGHQIQVEQTMNSVSSQGIDVEHLRWWDPSQTGDLIHFFGIPDLSYLHMAKLRGLPVVLTHLFTGTCNRSDLHLRIQGLLTQSLIRLPGWGNIKNQLSWLPLGQANRVIVGLRAEVDVLRMVYALPKEKISCVPLGLADEFFASRPERLPSGQPFLISHGTICDRKRSIQLARIAREARVPILFFGNPYSANEPYWKEFSSLVDQEFVLHHPHSDDTSQLITKLRQAAGYVCFSRHENWCLAAHEAAAVGLPVLLPDQKWSRERFGSQASYWNPDHSKSRNVEVLKGFYKVAPTSSPPSITIPRWQEVGSNLAQIYREVLGAAPS